MSGARSRNVLIISYYFPPLGMGGVQRVVSLTSHLTRLGWKVSVLTVKPFAYPAVDASLLKRVPKSVTVYRAAAHGAEKFKALFSRSGAKPGAELTATGSEIARWAMLPDSKVISLPNLLTLLPNVIKKSNTALVVTSSPPPSIHLAGAYAKKRFGLSWVADFRDVWFPQSQIDFRTPLHRKLQNLLESAYVRNADTVVAVSNKHADTLRGKYVDCEAKVHHISNGFEELDFSSALPEAGEGPLSIGYCGTLNHLTYISELFELFSSIAETHQFTVDVMGVVTSSVKLDIKRIDLDGKKMKLIGAREHFEAIQFIRSRDINLITLAANAHLESTIPGKVYEILRAERPAIGVFPRDSAAWELLSRFDNVLLVDASDVFAHRQEIEAFMLNSRHQRVRRDGVEEYDWNNLAERYDQVLKRAID